MLHASFDCRDCEESNEPPRNSKPNNNSSSHKPKFSLFQHSLFSNVPPTVRFASPSESKIQKPRKSARKVLRWSNNNLLPKVMRKILANSHFKIVPEQECWIGYWGKHFKTPAFRKVLPYQKVNHFPGAFNLGRKDKLWTNINRHMQCFSCHEFDIMPKTFILPRDAKLLKDKMMCDAQLVPVILKPPASARGTGIRVVHRWSNVPRKTPLIVQTYIENPFLIKGSKFDLRLYVYVTSFDPLIVYYYEDGLVRFASVKYSKNLSSFNNRLMHLTNYTLNKMAEHDENLPNKSETGVKWSLKKFWSYMTDLDVDVEKLRTRIIDLIIKTFISCSEPVNQYVEQNLSFPTVCHELYGLDVVLDENLKPWLLEVNISPSLQTSSEIDVQVKTALSCDTLNLAGFNLPDSDQFHSVSARLSANFTKPRKKYMLDYRAKPQKATMLTTPELEKQQFYVETFISSRKIDPSILDSLTPNDLRLLIELEDQFERKGNFTRIFPSYDTTHYLKYFLNVRYANLLMDEWINQYFHIRKTGVGLLEAFCRQKRHLVKEFSAIENVTSLERE